MGSLKADGSIKAWGSQHRGGENAPKGGGYTQNYSTNGAFSALKADGPIKGLGYVTQGGELPNVGFLFPPKTPPIQKRKILY
jgi:hypothetical protein